MASSSRPKGQTHTAHLDTFCLQGATNNTHNNLSLSKQMIGTSPCGITGFQEVPTRRAYGSFCTSRITGDVFRVDLGEWFRLKELESEDLKD